MASDSKDSIPDGTVVDGTIVSVSDMKAVLELDSGAIGEIHPPYLDNVDYDAGDRVAVSIQTYTGSRYIVIPAVEISPDKRIALIAALRTSVSDLLNRGGTFAEVIDIGSRLPFEFNIRYLRVLLTDADLLDGWEVVALTVGFESNQHITGRVASELEHRWLRIGRRFYGDQ